MPDTPVPELPSPPPQPAAEPPVTAAAEQPAPPAPASHPAPAPTTPTGPTLAANPQPSPTPPATAGRTPLKVPKPESGELIPIALVITFVASIFLFLGYFAYKNLTKPAKVENRWPLLERRAKDLRLIPLKQVLHAEQVEPLDADSQYLDEKWVDNPPDLPEDVIYGREGRRRHRITYTWTPKKIATEDGEKETIPSLTSDWAFGAIFRDKDNRSWPGFPLISKYAYEGDLEIDTTVNLPSRARLFELYTYYIYEGEQTGLKVLFFVPETSLYDQEHGKAVESRIHAQVYLLRYDRYYALTEPQPTSIEPFKDFTLLFRCIDRTIDLTINGDKVLICTFPDQWPADDSYIGGVPGLTFSDGQKPHHAGFIQFKALDFGDQQGKGYLKQLTIRGTPVHVKINTMRERVWWTDYRPRYLEQQQTTGQAEVTPLIPDPTEPAPAPANK